MTSSVGLQAPHHAVCRGETEGTPPREQYGLDLLDPHAVL
jgi:hypothetical protein